MQESNKKEWETPEFKELEISEQFKKLYETPEFKELEKTQLAKQALDSLNKNIKELHGIYQELHEISKILKRKG